MSKPQRLDDRTQEILTSFLRDIRQLPNESAKRTRFATLIGELFPGSKAVTRFPEGTEKIVRIDTSVGRKTGRIDSYYGNAVIEFEKSLRATGNEAESQLREYIAGVWSSEPKPPRPLIAIASDGATWRIYLPRLHDKGKGRITPEDVELEPTRELIVTEQTLADFWLWLTSLLFRPGGLATSSEQFRLDFGATSAAFVDGMQALRRAWVLGRKEPEPRLAFETWQKYLTVTYGSLAESSGTDNGGSTGSKLKTSELEELFIKHTYLASVARFLVWAALSKGKADKPLRKIADAIHSGEFFQARNIANLVEEDFFQWVRRPEAEEVLAPIWERMLDQILTYDLSRLDQDVLKGVYQDLVDPRDRHDLGEYYTPDWLCERIITRLLPSKGWVSVLDPACGSGSFLRATIVHLLSHNAEGSENERLRQVLEHVVGIDIHPLAVTISRTTYVLALGTLAKAAKRPIQIPVYLADSLFLPAEVEQHRLGEKPEFEIRFGGQSVRMPEDFVEAPDLFDVAISACSKVAVDHARTGKETISSLGAYLSRELDGLVKHKESEKIIEALWQFTEALARQIRAKKNSIWGFIVRNSYRPAMLREHFDFIVGNPPWLSYRYIADPEYQREVKERAVERYAIAPKSQKLFTQMELAAVFFAHAIVWFGKSDAKIGFVMPRNILSADQHANLREREYKAYFRLTEYWDLKDVRPTDKPLFNVPSCVLFGKRDKDRGSKSETLPAQEWTGEPLHRDVPWSLIEPYITIAKKGAQIIYLGSRTALSTSKGRLSPHSPSPYARRFHQGATIVPHSFYFVRVPELDARPVPDKLYWAETDPVQAQLAKAPYDNIRLTGNVEGRFVFCCALARDVSPFTLQRPVPVILPIISDNGRPLVLSSEALREKGYRECASWMQKAERIWQEKRGEKADNQNLYQWLDYQGKLSSQDLNDAHLVLYNAPGTNLAATQVDRESLPIPLIVEHTVYWASCTAKEEADYVVAVLNSDAVNEAIKPFQALGLMGERHVEKKVLDVPFPDYSAENSKHRDLARLGAAAQTKAEALTQKGELPVSLARRRAAVREHVKGILKEIDAIVRTLI